MQYNVLDKKQLGLNALLNGGGVKWRASSPPSLFLLVQGIEPATFLQATTAWLYCVYHLR